MNYPAASYGELTPKGLERLKNFNCYVKRGSDGEDFYPQKTINKSMRK